MRSRDYLGNFELMILLAIIRVGENAYGVPIAQELEDVGLRNVAMGSVYAALERLEQKGLVKSRLGEATTERGGRAKTYFNVTPKGVKEVRKTQQTLIQLWQGLPRLNGGKA